MKQKDLALILAIIGFSALFSFVLFNVVFGNSTNVKTKAEVVEPISAEFPLPSKDYFNNNSLNPTQVVTISPDQNQDPFQ